MGKDMSAADYVDFGLMRDEFQREVEALMAPFDAFLLPTTPCIAPPIAEVERERRGLLPLERAHPAQGRAGELPRRLRGVAALPRAGRGAGRPDGLRPGDERPAHPRGGGCN